MLPLAPTALLAFPLTFLLVWLDAPLSAHLLVLFGVAPLPLWGLLLGTAIERHLSRRLHARVVLAEGDYRITPPLSAHARLEAEPLLRRLRPLARVLRPARR